MKKIIQYILAIILSVNLYGTENSTLPVVEVISKLQSQQEEFNRLNLFLSPEQRSVAGVGNYIHYLLDERALQNAFTANYNSIRLELPLPDGASIGLLLTRNEILAGDFSLALTSSKGEHQTFYKPGLYYHGIVEGNPKSIVALSLFNNHLIGMVCDESGNWNLGALEENGRAMIKGNEYVYFNDKSFQLPLYSSCGTTDDIESIGQGNNGNQRSVSGGGCVRIFMDCDYDFYIYKASNADAVADYVTALFNLESIIYANESVNISLSGINVWTVADPFNLGDSYANMQSYGDYRRTNFNGDLAQLIAKDAGGLGGIAWLNVLCTGYNATYHLGPVSYCDINATYPLGALIFPTYTWDANVIVHELGHNLGSYHTHWCGWSGGAIDNCNTCWNPPVAFEGTCTSAPTPLPYSGTMMSYCHGCVGIGVNLVTGFGPQPGNVIRARIAAVSCLSDCISSSCVPGIDVAIPIGAGENIEYTASNLISGNSLIQNGATVSFTAGNAVSLTPGFNAQMGSIFTAAIASCEGNLLPSSNETGSSLETGTFFEPLTDEQKEIILSAYPNPFKESVTISFMLPKSENAMVKILSMEGKELATLFQGNVIQNEIYQMEFRAGLLKSGVYFYRMITASGTVQNKKLLLIN